MDPKYLGGKKRSHGHFTMWIDGRLYEGCRHVPMTKLERDRFFKSNYLQHGRKTK